MLHRQWIGLNEGDTITVAPLDISAMGKDIILAGIDLAIGFMKPRMVVEEVFSVDDLCTFFHDNFDRVMCTPGQMFFFDYHGQKMKATVKGMSCPTNPPPRLNPFGRLSKCRSAPSREIWTFGQCNGHLGSKGSRQYDQAQEQRQKAST